MQYVRFMINFECVLIKAVDQLPFLPREGDGIRINNLFLYIHLVTFDMDMDEIRILLKEHKT